MIIKQAVTQHIVWPQIWWLCGIAEMMFRYEGLALVITKLDQTTAEFNIKQIEHTIAVSIANQLRNVVGDLGFEFVREKDCIRATYDPAPGQEWQRRVK